MKYLFEKRNRICVQKELNAKSEYIKWMKFILRRSKVVGNIELPISAVVIDEKGRCIGRGSNNRNSNNDPLGHAEIIALKQASLLKNDWRFNECQIITNLEPCTMCTSVLIQARMGRVIYGAYDAKRGGLGGAIDLSKHKSSHHNMEVIGGILEEECKENLQLWFKKLRSQK